MLRPLAAGAENFSDTYSRIKPSLALVVAAEGKTVGLGTAFCIASDSHFSYFLTSKHVVSGGKSIELRLEVDPTRFYRGTVVRESEPPLDAAIVKVDKANTPPLILSTANPPEGQPVAIAGYPYFQIEVAEGQGGMSPSVHSGIVNALPFDGYYVEHDALQDHGNSGGPLFDQSTGLVYGIVTYGVQSKASQSVQNNLAISITKSFAFIKNADVLYTSASPDALVSSSTPQITGPESSLGSAQPNPTQARGTLKDAPGAYHFLMTHGTIQMSPGAQPISDTIDGQLELGLGGLTSSTIVTGAIANFDPTTITAACASFSVIGVIGIADTWDAKVTLVTNVVSGNMVINMFDCSGQVWYSSIKSKKQVFPYGSVTNQYKNVMLDLANQAVSDIQTQTSQNPSALKNFVRYGIPIADGYKSPLFWLLASPGGAYVGVLPRFSTAARAGLQLNDVVTTLNGHPTAGLSQDDINTLMGDIISQGGKWNLTITTADGNTAKITFDSEDIRWYLTHPLRN